MKGARARGPCGRGAWPWRSPRRRPRPPGYDGVRDSTAVGEAAMMAVRLLVVDDHAVVRRGVRALLEEQPGWEVCGEAASGREAVEQVTRLRPDIVVLDLSLPELHGLEATRQILA